MTAPVDVARPARVGMLVRGLLYLLTAIFFAFGLYLVFQHVFGDAETIEGRAILTALLGPCLVWYVLGDGVLRIREGLSGGAYLRTDAVGLHYRVRPESFLGLGFQSAKAGTIRWDQFRHTTSHTVRYAGITVRRELYLVDGKQVAGIINLYPFKESTDQVMDTIDRARPVAQPVSSA